MQQYIFDKIRIQLLSDEIIRLEYAKNGNFCDENTFFIPNRTDYKDTVSACAEEGGVICFGEYKLYVPANGKGLSGIRLERCGKKIYSYKKLTNSGELPALGKTPEVFAISDTPRIIVPEGGYSDARKGEYKVEENVQDVYLLLCKNDAKKLRRLYVGLTGRCELVRLSTLGGWNSKYYAYTEEEAKQLILDYEKHNVPLDVMVIDTDWRTCERGCGYDINTKLFPDMKRFLDFAHAHGVEIMFNDHPEPVDGAHVFEPKEIKYREEKLKSLMSLGLDIWWYDRNWCLHLFSPSENIFWETLGLYLYQDVTKQFYQKQSGDKQIYRRPVIMGNVVNIINGWYQKIQDTASHRYSIQWTGDISCNMYSLAQEVNSLVCASENCIAYVNADCGGHLGNPDKNLFIRWMQFGTLSPVFRPHCTSWVERPRDPWVYDEETLNIVREYNYLRYRLLPVLYRYAYESYTEGSPICRRLSWQYPEDKRARGNNAYMIGNNLLVQPVLAESCPEIVPKKNFVAPVKATYYNGRELKGDPIATAEYPFLNMDLNREPPEKGVPIYDFSARFEAVVQFEQDVKLFIRCDDGSTVWIDGEKVLEDKKLHSALCFELKRIEGGKPHRVVIEYFQAGGEASCMLQYCKVAVNPACEVYLPAGRWMDLFDGKLYAGGKTIRKEYGLREMPLFVRLGALVPLAYDARNTKEQKWDRLVYDFYPCKEAADCGYLYEDDTETTAYKLGQFRKSAYEAKYCEEENAFVVKLYAAQGSFKGDKCFTKREVTLKYHLLKGANGVKKITVNGENYVFDVTAKNGSAFPLNAGVSVPDGKVICTNFEADADKDVEVRFYL